MRIVVSLLIFASVCSVQCDNIPMFYAFGDWGDNTATMRQVVSQLRSQPTPEFVALLGDCFYPKGVQSVDDEKFNLFTSFSDISQQFLIAVGNHDYGYSQSVPAMIQYSQVNPKWILPSRYYMKQIQLANGVTLCIVVLDTHVFDKTQLNWLEASLKSCPGQNTYRIVMTHYPLVTAGLYASGKDVARLRQLIMPLMEKYKVHAYISGHEHQSQAIEINGVHYIIAGATAQLNRRSARNDTDLGDRLKFFNDREAAFAAFTIDTNSISYSFIRAHDGKKIFSSSIPLEKGDKDSVSETTSPSPSGRFIPPEKDTSTTDLDPSPVGEIFSDKSSASYTFTDFFILSAMIVIL